jgi:hypothetical protein
MGSTNCGFLTFEQCQATVSGIGGSCRRSQFYNPGYASAGRKKTTILVCVTTSHPMPRVAAGAFGFLTLIQVFDGPE